MLHTITTDHAALLAKSGISVDYALSHGVTSALEPGDLPDGAPGYWAGLLPALVFPWCSDDRVEWQLRPDSPGGDWPKYLFRGSSDGYVPTPWILRRPTGGAPVIYVEGTKQALCVAEHAPAEYGVVGLAGCWGGQERGLAADVLGLSRRRDAIVVLDADVRRNVQVYEAGRRLRGYLLREGAVRVLRLEVLGPNNIGIDDVIGSRSDPREHLARLIGLADDYRYPLKDRPKPRPGSARALGTVAGPSEPAPSARDYLRATADGTRSLVRWWRESWCAYDVERGCWVQWVEKDAMTTRLFRFFEHAIWADDGVITPWNPGPASIAGVEAALKAFSGLGSTVDAPCWLEPDSPRPPAEEFLAFPNGVLHVPTRRFLAPRSDLFTLRGMPFTYDSDASVSGTRWEKFVYKELFEDDPEQADRLQEIMGYIVSGRTDLQKLFVLVGPRRAGKGVITRVITKLMGGASTATSLKLMSGDFGKENLLGKSLATLGDVRLGGHADRVTDLVADLLSISGQDDIAVNRKNKSVVIGRLGINFLMSSNDDLVFQDDSGALAGRFETIQLSKTFAGHEDGALEATLGSELPSILSWCLDGLKRLESQSGSFTRSLRTDRARQDMALAGSPYLAFAEEALVVEQGAWSSSQDVYARWLAWEWEQGGGKTGKVGVMRGLVSALRHRGVSSVRIGSDRRRGLSNVRIVPVDQERPGY